MSGSIIPSWYIVSTWELIASERGFLGSVLISLYIFSSERWSRPSFIYCSVSSTTIPEPLSAVLMINVWSDLSCLSALFCVGVRLGVNFSGCNVFISVLILFR